MFDFLGKKAINRKNNEQRPRPGAGSLLDVVVPFSPKASGSGPNGVAKSLHNSLFSQMDVLVQERQQADAEKQALERAESQAKKAAFERSEQMARIEAERDASRRFEEKASKLAAEIETVRQNKFRQHTDAQMNAAEMRGARTVGSLNDRHASPAEQGAEQDRAQFERFQQWQRMEAGQRDNSHENGRPNPSYFNDGEYARPHYRDQRPDYGDYGRPDAAQGTDYRQDERRFDADRKYEAPWRHDRAYNSQQFARPNDPAAELYPQTNKGSPPEQQADTGGLYGQNQAADQSLPSAGLDLDKIFSSIFSSWKLIGGFAIVGAVLAGIYAKTLPNKYEAWAELLIDPQGITLIDKQLSSTGYGGEAMIAYLESQLRIIASTSVLNVVIDTENLLADTEFSGSGTIGLGLFNILGSGSNATNSERDRQIVLDNLQDKLTIARGSRTFIVSIGMMSEDPEKSARIANAIARAYVNGESGARSKIARDASEDLSDKLETLRNRVLLAEQKVVDYKSENGLATSDGKLISEVQLSRINEQLAIARIETVNARTKMEQLRSIDLSDVISGALPASLNTGTLSQFRIRYATLKSAADRLSTKLGPKHPERIAVGAELESSKRQISREIRRSIAGSKQDFERAKTRQNGLNQQLNTVKAAAVGTGNSLIALRELDRELAAHRRVYEDYLLRSRETSEQEGLTTTNARVISIATAPLQKASPNRKVIAGVGLIAGGLLGMMIALMRGMFAGRRQTKYDPNSEPDHNQFAHQAESAGMYRQQAPYSGVPYDSEYSRTTPHSPQYPPRNTRPV